ncbi:MAG TPA: hypothetical protein VFX33_00250 [Actinomycetales bacterium]|nr:hypothetical protein [Actinomycetales bacterium]
MGVVVARASAVLAVLLALAAAAFLLLQPCAYRGEVVDASGERSTCASLVEVNGWGVAVALAVPVLLAVVGAALSATGRRGRSGITVGLLGAFCVLTGFTVGLFFLPACAALLVAVLASGPTPGAAVAPT